MEWIEQYGAVAAFLLLALRMLLEFRRSTLDDFISDMERHRVSPERMARALEELDRRFDLLPIVVLKRHLKQLDDIHAAVVRKEGGGT